MDLNILNSMKMLTLHKMELFGFNEWQKGDVSINRFRK